MEFDQDALDEIFRLTKGYPYFLREWGYQSWNLATQSLLISDIFTDSLARFAGYRTSHQIRQQADRLLAWRLPAWTATAKIAATLFPFSMAHHPPFGFGSVFFVFCRF